MNHSKVHLALILSFLCLFTNGLQAEFSIRGSVIRPAKEEALSWLVKEKAEIIVEKSHGFSSPKDALDPENWKRLMSDKKEPIDIVRIEKWEPQNDNVVTGPPGLSSYATSMFSFDYKGKSYVLTVEYSWEVGFGIKRELKNWKIVGPIGK